MIAEFRSLFPLIRRYRWSYVLGVLSLLVTSGAQLAIPQYTARAIDLITESGAAVGRLTALLAAMIGTAVVVAIGRFGWRYFIHGASRRIETELRGRLFDHLLTLPQSYYEEVKTGDLMARATNDMNAIRMAIGMALVAFIDGLFMTVAILAILISQNARLALYTVIPLPLITISIILIGRRVGRLFRLVQEGFSRLSDEAQEVLTGIRVVQTFVKERYVVGRFGDANDNYQAQNMKLVRIWGLFFPLVMFLSGATLLLLLWFGGQRMISGELSAGMFVATLSYLQMLTWPMLGAGFTVNMLQRGAASLARVNQVLSVEPRIADPSNPRPAPRGRTVETRALTFHYQSDGPAVLRSIDLSAPQGTMLGIIGRTASGKSTLLSALTRTVDPPPGTVYVDGADIREYRLDDLRGVFAVVPQYPFLFSATIEDNIRFARPDAADVDVHRVGELAALDTDIHEFPARWKTVVGERGVTLSGGQRQRMALARALLADAPILLLDDALSAVDSRTEERILASLLEARRGRTTVVVSNRVSTVMAADSILVMDDGAVVERGTHAELAAAGGLYSEIERLQRLTNAAGLA